ncbi:hypothetical protein GGR52DRAFT_572194 [Hypoxylon sp. FL1284]|nr:hypothetical protein GGR52DRAFT_572194 [Hypoxylon sp. FL1284]
MASTDKINKNQTGDAEGYFDDSALKEALGSIARKGAFASSRVVPPFYPEVILRRVLHSWSREVESGLTAPSPRYWVLNHKYPNANISLEEDDGPALFDISLYHRDFDHLKEVVIPIAEKPYINTGFVLSFLKALHQSIKRGQVPQDEAKLLYERVARKAMLGVKFATLTAPEHSSQMKVMQPLATNILAYDSMLKFISTLVALELDEHLRLFSERISQQAKQISKQTFKPFWISFLQGLFPVFKRHNVSPGTPPDNNLSEPPGGLLVQLRPRASLKIDIHSPLRQFVTCFPVPSIRRQHLEEVHDWDRADCVTETVDEPQRNSSNPVLFSLLVTKRAAKLYKVRLDAWRRRRLQAEHQLEVFDQDMLRTVLADQFDAIMSMKLVGYGEGPQATQTTPQPSSSQRHGAPTAAFSGTPEDQLAPKPSMLEVSRSISASANKLRMSRSISARSGSSSRPLPSPSGEGPLHRSTVATIPSPIAGTKRKHIEVDVVDLTGEN